MLPECGDFLYTEFGTIQLMEDPKLEFKEFDRELGHQHLRAIAYIARAVMDEEKFLVYWTSLDQEDILDCDWNDYVVIKTN